MTYRTGLDKGEVAAPQRDECLIKLLEQGHCGRFARARGDCHSEVRATRGVKDVRVVLQVGA